MSEAGEPASGGRGPDQAALVVALILIVIAAIVAYDAATIRTGVAGYARIGPRAFPYAVASGLAVLAVATAVKALREAGPALPRDDLRPGAWIIAGLIVQIALLPFAGFSIATGAVFAATARAFGRGPIWLTWPIGTGFALAVWVFFAKILNLVLPAGPLERLF